MKNLEVAKLLYEIADLLEIKGVEWKPRAYRRAAQNIETLSEDIEKLHKEGKIREIPGVGEHIGEKIEEFLKTGKLKYYEDLKREIPSTIEKLMQIPEIGPKTAKLIYDKLKIKRLNDLKRYVLRHKIRAIKGLGIKTEDIILRGLKNLESREKRFLLGQIYPIAKDIEEELNSLRYVKKAVVAGSLRRMKETIGDVDILVSSSNPGKVMDFFTKMEEVKEIIAKGVTKSSVKLNNNLQVDIRVVNDNVFGSALQYFTGSKQHSISLRKVAIKKGYKLSEYGLFKGKKNVVSKTEEDVYKRLGLRYIEPELREDTGEIEAALKNKLPKLISYNDIKGALHVHTNWSDGHFSIKEMVLEAKKLGYKYITITDHSGSLVIANALDEKRIIKQGKEIDKVNKDLTGIKILKGVEVNITKDGNLDVSNNVLKQLDFVIASIHSGFKNSKEVITKRILKAMENKYVNAIAHPTGRKLMKRDAYDVDFDKVFEKAKETNTLLEVNCQPDRLDLKDVYIKEAINRKVKLCIGLDAHALDHFSFLRYGVGVARRGWASKKDIVNCNDLNRFLKIIDKK